MNKLTENQDFRLEALNGILRSSQVLKICKLNNHKLLNEINCS